MNHSFKGNFSATHEKIAIINSVLNVPLMLISVAGNALVFAAILRYPSIRSTSMIMLCSLHCYFRPAHWNLSPAVVYCWWTHEPEKWRPYVTPHYGNGGVFCLWSLSWYNDFHQRGPIHGFALPFEIFHFSYKTTRRVCLGNDLVVHLSVVSNLSLE